MKKFVLIAMLLSLNAHADAGLCDKLGAIKENNQQQLERFTLTQLDFDSKSELAIIVHVGNMPAQIKQVTFNRGQVQLTCYFKPLAFAQGGLGERFWGWHLIWAEPQGLFYARMDGEAWVSSLPKRLSKLASINPQFKLDDQNILVTWQQVENGTTVNMQALSSDEGRSWEIGTQ
jgi:hypothetical protein